MAIVELPPFIRSMSGKLGDVVYRTSKNGKTFTSKLPRKSGKPLSEAQLRHQERFNLANEYANRARGEPVYVKLAKKTGRAASRIAFSDWFHAPVIHEVSRRSGCIRIDASDNVHVAKVRVTISDEEGNLLEQGDAAQTSGNAWWEFATSTRGTILVEVWDLAGNVTGHEA